MPIWVGEVCKKQAVQFYRPSITFWKGFDCPPAISTREIRFDGSSAILASAIKIDVERLKNSPRRFNSFTVADKSGRDGGCAFCARQVVRVFGKIVLS